LSGFTRRTNPSTPSTRRAAEPRGYTAPAGTSTTSGRSLTSTRKGAPLPLARLLHPPRRPARQHRDLCEGHQLDAGDRPGGQRAARGSELSLGDSQCRFAVEETDDPSTATPTRSTRASSTQKRSAPSRSTRTLVLLDNSARNAGWCRRCTTRADDAAPRRLVVVPGGRTPRHHHITGCRGAGRLRWGRPRQPRVER
jgi:hypothetical protein